MLATVPFNQSARHAGRPGTGSACLFSSLTNILWGSYGSNHGEYKCRRALSQLPHAASPPAPPLSVVEPPRSPARITPTTRGTTDAGTTPHPRARVAQHSRPDTSTVAPATDTRWSGTRSVSGNSTTSTTAENVRSLEEYFARQRTRSADLPDPEPVVRYLAHCAVEVLLGARDLDQLARWVTGQVYQQLHTRVALAARARAAK